MNESNFPCLKNRTDGSIIHVDSDNFSLGRGLGCSFVIPNKTVSRVHCVLERDKDNWILKDTSTNGTYVNGYLIKGAKSSHLKDGDAIVLDIKDDGYAFQTTPDRSNCVDDQPDGITDEQLSSLADAMLSEVEVFTDRLRVATPVPAESTNNEVPSINPLLDHIDMVKSSEEPANKRQKTGNVDEPVPVQEMMEVTVNSAPQEQQDKSSQKAGCSMEKPSAVINESPKKTKPANTASQDYFQEMENELQCAICSEFFIKATTLNCSHSFCKYCIELWKKTKSDCPICRARITSMTSTIVLDNVIEKVIDSLPLEDRKHRKETIEEREKLEKEKAPGPKKKNKNPPQSVIELSSDSSSSSGNSDTSSETDDAEWRDEYDEDDWYDVGISGAYYGGYGHCYCCGRSGHWANGCPYR